MTEFVKTIALAAMPWNVAVRPSAAVGALSAYLKEHAASWAVTSVYGYVDVAMALGHKLYDCCASNCYSLGELLYLSQLYPERAADIQSSVQRLFASRVEQGTSPGSLVEGATTWLDVANHTRKVIDSQLEAMAEALAKYAVVGLTTSFGQVFSNLALAKRLKASNPAVTIVIGGPSVSARIGPALVREYSFLDFVVQGEGETPLLQILRFLEYGQPIAGGVLSRTNASELPDGAPLVEVSRLDDLPMPDFDEYARLAEANGIPWDLPIEGSRGCWWDRVKKTGDARDTCYFCNLNVQWNGYRQKSEERIALEVDTLSNRYANNRIYFLDNIIRHKGIERLAGLLKALDKDLDLFYEMRASVRPVQLAHLWQAGLRKVQVGIEALSSSLLARIGKGTTTIQNLEIMRTCFELGILNNSNLMLDFPTSTTAEVEETLRNVRDYAICFEPLEVTTFQLGVGATAEVMQEQFGITNVRASDRFKVGMPRDVWERLPTLTDLSFETTSEGTDWSPVRALVDAWKTRQKPKDKHQERFLLSYEDGRTFLRIMDRRSGARDHILRGAGRAIYLYCTEIRTLESVTEAFCAQLSERSVLAFIDRLVGLKVIFREGSKVLSIAPARDPAAAARRIHAVAAIGRPAKPSSSVSMLAAPAQKRGRSLPVVGDHI